MDTLDLRIVSLLQADGTATNAGIARQVDVSEETVRRRVKRLIESELMKVVAVANPEKLGYESEALVALQVDADEAENVAETLAKFDEINWVSITAGSFDIFAWVSFRSLGALSSFLRLRVGVIPGVRKTETFVSLAGRRQHHGVAV